MPKGTTINANRYCETKKTTASHPKQETRNAFKGIVLLHDSALPDTAHATQELLDQFGWGFFDHPPYSPDLSPSDFHLFFKLKEFLGGKRFGSDEELGNAVTTCLNELEIEEYDIGILKLVDRHDKCLKVGGDYVEK
ncbi:Histone-lysine N-methyltransferase SETMAR [Araneus ventricosus]|uniref:Histone-lysine N-methyltransferase SETMAR n=1 Tax=Araneus ventricosus TaxID=182803 RepID=A0A4Y2V0D3_ARAVE|nr:Histone-lysine N-methyltransferase SETMAR [Araneus ventricosus]GBO17824.1 Histone-lysine N-methyltransferase SETMAR [Araneus ventricosus]